MGKKKSLGEIADAIQEEQTTAPVRPSLADIADGITDEATAAPEVPAGGDPFAQPPAQGAFSPDPGSPTGSASRSVEWPKELDAPTPAPQQPIPQGKLTPDAKYEIPEDTADPAMGIRKDEVLTGEQKADMMASPQAREAMKDYRAYATTYGDLDLPAIERTKGTLAKTKEQLSGLVESFRMDTENLDSQTDSLIALRKRAEDAVEQELPEANSILADFNQRRDRYNAMSEALQKKADALYDLDEVVRRNERHLVRREYDIKADTGGPLGAFYNSTLRGAGKVRAGLRGYAIDAIITMAPESSLNGMSKNDAARTFKKMMLPVDREFFVDRLGTESTTNEYIDKVHDKNLVGSALLSVAETLPAIGAPYGIGLFLQSSDQAAQEMEAPEFDDVPEWKKRLFSTAYGATIGRLEHVGLKNVASRTPLVKQMFARAIKEVPADASAETIKRTLADRVVDMAKAYSKDVALGSVSEFETGGLQSMAENALKEAFNEAEGKKLFKHAEGWTGYIEDALVEGAAEAIGGAFFAQPFAVQSAMNAKGLGATATNEQYENLEKMFTDDLYRGSFEAMVKQQVDASKISQAKANEVVEAWKEASSIAAKVPGGLSTEKRREAFDLLREKAQLSKQDKAMVGDKITVINEKLAALAGVSAPNQGENAKPEKGSNSDRDVKQATGASEAGDQRSSTAVPGLDTEGGAGTNDGGATPEPVQGVLSDTGDAGVQDEVPAADPVPEVGVPAEAPGEGDGIEKPYLTKDGKHRVTYDPETQQAEVEPLAPKPHISQWEHLSPANARRAKRKAMQAYSQAKSRARKEFAKATGQKVAPASNTLKEAGQDNKAITKQANNYSSPELGVYGTALRYFATGGKMSAAKGKTRAHMGWGDGSEITSQEKIAGWLLDDNAPSVEDVAHSIWENWPEGDVDSRPDTSEILDAVIEVAGKFENATGALGSLKDYFPEVDTDTQQRYDQEWAAAEQQRIMEEDLARGETKLDNMSDAEYEQLVAETEESEKAVHSQNDAVPQESQAPDRQAAEQTGSAPGEEGAGQKGGKDPEAERLRGEVARARQARSNFIADFNDRGSALFDEQEGNLQTSIDGGFDNSQENYNERLAEYDAAVTAAERALADHEKASRPDPNQTSLEDAAEGPKKPAKKASFARTEDQKEEVRKRMAERLKRLGKGGNLTSSGISPRDMEDLVGLVGDVVELGYHKLKDVIEQIKAMVDDRLFPHITEAYRKFRDTFEQDAEVRYSLETDAEIEAETGSGGQRQGDVRGRERVRPSGQPSGARPAIRIANQEALPVPERQYVVDGDYPIDEHQRLGVNLALNYFRKPGNEGRAFLLADGAGVGKTREILATADMVRKDTGKPVMIVSLRGALDDSFKKDAKAMGIDLSNFETGTYDDLNAGKVGKGEYALVIYDESHNLKNPLSGRSTASKRVKTANTMFTSATPFDKSEFAIRFMSDITGKTNEEVENELGVEIEIVEDRYGNIRPMAKYPFGFMTYLERLVAMRNQVIADGGMIRREYPFYGTVQEMDAGAMPAELQSEVAKVEEIASKREEAAENLVKAKWASERARVMGTNFNKEWKWVDDGVRSGKLQEEYGRRYRDFIRDERRQSLDAIDKLTEPHKVDVAIKEAKKAIANGEQVIMVVEGVGDRTAKMGSEKSKYGYFERKVTPATESLKKAMDAAGISYALIAGGNRSGSYQKEQDRFNKGEAQVLIMTAKSGGTGINLDDTVGDAPRRMIMLTPPYGGDTFEQAIGRVSRRNTASPSTVQTMRFQGNRSDDNRAEKVAMKRSVIDAVVIGDDLDMRRLEQNAPPEAMAQLSPKSGSQAALRNDARDLVDGWYSRLHESVAAKGRTQPASEWKNWIAARANEGAFSLEEAKWTGLSDWLASKGKEKVTPQQVREFLKENRVKVEVVEKGDNYSEDDVVRIEDEDDNGTALRVVFSDGTSQIVDYISDAEYAAQKEKRDKAWDEMQRIRVEYDALRGGMPTAEWNEANPDKAAALKEEFEKHRSIVSIFDNPPVRFAQGKEAAIREAVYNANEASVPVAGGAPQFSEYQLPGGTNYREVLVTLPLRPVRNKNSTGLEGWNVEEVKPLNDAGVRHVILRDSSGNKLAEYTNARRSDRSVMDRYISESGIEKQRQETFKSSHFDEPNILVHLRLNDRTGPNGEKILFIEELQSDWAQRGRKEGFDVPSAKLTNADLQQAAEEAGPDWDGTAPGKRTTPSAPFVTDTNAWVELGLKQAIRMAAQGGYDKVAWSTGEQQFNRWGSQAFAWSKGKTGWRIVGKEQSGGEAFAGMEEALAQEAKESDTIITSKEELREVVEDVMGRERSDYSPENWKTHINKMVDGMWERMQNEDSGTTMPRREGMKGFYDKILPAVAKKVSKKLGGDGDVKGVGIDIGSGESGAEIMHTVESDGTHVVEQGGDRKEFDNEAQASAYAKELRSRSSSQQSIFITPEMRAKVLQGVPLMQGNLRGNIKDAGLKGSVEAVAKALSAIAPNVKIIVHADPMKFFSEAYLAGATGDGNSSVTAFYNASANEIHINAQDAKSTTLFHEAAHPVLAAAIQNNPELVNSLYNELAGRPDFAKYKKFGQQYEGENLQKVEALVEFMADVAAGNVTQAANPNSLWQKVKAWLNDVLSKIGFGPKDIKLDPSSLRAFADGFAKAMRDGIRINGDKLRADMTVAEQRRAAEFTPDEIAGNIKAKGLSKAEAEAFMKQKGMSQSKIDAVLKAYDGAQQGQFAFINPPMPPGEVQDAFEKQEAEAKKHRLSFGKRLYRSYIQKFEDKKGVAKDLLSQAGAAEAVIRLNLVSGAGGAAKAKFTKYHAQVHGDLNTTEKSVLNNIIQARRIINLDEKYDGITAPKKQHPYGMTGESVQTWLNDLAVKHPELHSKLMGRADAYFKAMGEMLEMKHKEGIISDELYDKLKNDEYSPREFVHHLVDAEERMVIGTTDVSRTGIKRLLDGSNEALFNNSEWLLANQVASTHKLVFNNRANKALYKWAVTEGDPEVAYPLQEGEEPRSGFQAISHFAGGHMIKVAVRNEIATPWLQSDAALRPDLANAIRVVTGGSLFRVMVTGANLTFAFRNFPRDVGHVLMFTNTYSNMLPRALAEMGLDLAKVSGDAFKRKGRYQEYMEEGGSMDFLTRQGRPLTSKESIFSKDGLLRRKTIAERGLDGFMHFAGYINETSEIVVRLAVREREISKLTDAFVLEKGREPDASELKWIKEQATAKAREYMDFNQGGEWAKAVDSAIPYLNAGFQGTRVMARYIKTNPKVFAWKMAQLSALTAMIMAHNLGHEDEWEEIPDEIKENNFVILIPRWTRMDKDGRKRTRYFTIPKTHDQRIFSSFVESIMEYVVLGKYPTKRSMIALKQATPFDPKRFMDVPLINAMNSYASGYDTYRDRNVFPRKDDVEDWAEYTQRTPGIYKDVARWTSTIDENGKMVGGLSPERSKLFVEKYAGLSENNMFFMLTNKAWEMGRGAFGGQSEEFDKSMIEHLNDVALPFYGSFIRETNPRSADEAFERHSRLEATRRHVESVAVKELVGKYNAASTDEQKNAVKKEAVDQINSFASEDRKRAIENFKNGILLKDVPYMYVAMKTEPMAVRVNTFAEAYRVATDREKEKMLEYANRVKLFTPELLKELKKKMAELDTMEKKGAEK